MSRMDISLLMMMIIPRGTEWEADSRSNAHENVSAIGKWLLDQGAESNARIDLRGAIRGRNVRKRRRKIRCCGHPLAISEKMQKGVESMQSILSPLQVRKFSTLFSLLDTNGDGCLSEADFREQARRILEAFGLAQDERRARLLFESRSELFHRLISGADKDRSGTVSLDEFLRYFERQILAHRAAGVASPWLVQSCRDVIELIDQDRNETISEAEYAQLLRAMGSDADPHVNFAKLDRDGDGKLTLKEMVALSLEFMTSDDPDAPGNFFFCGKV